MDTELLAKLLSLKQRDIDTRKRLLQENRLYGTYDKEIQNVHVENAKALNELVAVHGWPGISKVGLDGSRAAWLIAQHSICTPELQRKFLRLLEAATKLGEAPIKQVAFLTDRIRFNEGKPQIYGTVFDWNENGELYCELETPDQVDQLRTEVGLPPFQESLREHQKEVEAEGGKPPENFHSYKIVQSEWAKRFGWK